MERRLRIAAAGDVHCKPAVREQVTDSFAAVARDVDAILLAGDLTTHGEVEQGQVLADAVRPLELPVVAVLGNHDLHANRPHELTEVLEDADVCVLDRSWTVLDFDGCELGIAGVKGFVGGFPGSHLPDFGEPSLRAIYAETGEEAAALDRGLRAIANCPYRVALLHYSPSTETLEGEPREIWTMLGTDRLAAPIREHEPDLALHGHAHAGTFEGALGGVPVYNVSVPVMGRDFWVFELSAQRRPVAPIR
ncbi:MAG TPA: metallophosphoesterase [Thermoleophilaceae bacterium]|nr:metallophosphoesterase [Thermoleophilaceae bacterium]